MGSFRKWLKKQIGSRSLKPWEEDFAQDAIDDKSFVEPTSLDHLLGMLRYKRACKEAMTAAESCYLKWQEQDPRSTMDGFSAKDKERIRKATRQVWSWSHPKRLCVKRATNDKGFVSCDQCKQIVPKISVDHIQPVGKVDSGYLERLFCSSKGLQALCSPCHRIKTRIDNGVIKNTRKKKFTDMY